MRSSDLSKRLFDQPFRPFRIHLSDGKALDVRQPRMVIVRRSTAILPTRFGKDEGRYPFVVDWQTVALSHIVRFSDLRNGSNRSRGHRNR